MQFDITHGPPPWESSCRTRTGPVGADGAVDAQNAPTAPWKTLCVFHELPQGLSNQITHEKPRKAPKWRWETRIDPFPGFLTAEADFLVGELNQAYDLGDIQLVRLESFEDQITVTAEAIRAAGLDTQVFQLDDGPAQTTGSLLDAMKNLPGVTVDQDGRVSLRGSDRVAILIDGRQSSLTGFGSQRGLDSVSAANIEAIEIINNPSARFDAAGMAGIINIIYKREEELGFSGDIGFAIGDGQFSKRRGDLPTELGSFAHNPKIIPSLNLNHNTETVRSFVQGEILFQDDLPNNEFTTRFYDDGRVIESQVPENREQTHYIVRLGSDWNVDGTSTLSIGGIYDFETHTDRAQVPSANASGSGRRRRIRVSPTSASTGSANSARPGTS